jgi:hypothetical protein
MVTVVPVSVAPGVATAATVAAPEAVLTVPSRLKFEVAVLRLLLLETLSAPCTTLTLAVKLLPGLLKTTVPGPLLEINCGSCLLNRDAISLGLRTRL